MCQKCGTKVLFFAFYSGKLYRTNFIVYMKNKPDTKCFIFHKLLIFNNYNKFSAKKIPNVVVGIFVAKTGVEPVTSGL